MGARGKLPYFQSNETAEQMKLFLDGLEEQSKIVTDKSKGKLISVGGGFDYIVVAQRKSYWRGLITDLVREYDNVLFLLLLFLCFLCGFLTWKLRSSTNRSSTSNNISKNTQAAKNKK